MHRVLLLITSFLFALSTGAQTLFSENFSTGTGSTPPSGWTQNIISGISPADTWRFNNPGGRSTGSPISSPFAAFDADANSNNSTAENVALESPAINATGKTQVRLKWDQVYAGAWIGTVYVEVYNGSTWNQVYSNGMGYDGDFPDGRLASIDVDISAYAAGISNAKVRFRFTGDYDYWWIVDNVQVYALPTSYYFINEPFTTASGSTPPTGWTNNLISGSSSFDFFRFGQSGVFNSVGNPATRETPQPITGTFALFDSDNSSTAGGLENVALESPVINASGFSSNIRLRWDQDYMGGYQSGDSINVEVFNGTTWVKVYQNGAFANDLTANTMGTVDVDVTSAIANVTNAKIRFRWRGNWSWWWLIDNVQLYAPTPAPVPDFTINNASQCLPGNSFSFTNTSTIPGTGLTMTYSWNFGDLTNSTSTSPSGKTYASANTYTVTLTATSNQGVSASTSKTVTVNAVVTPSVSISPSPSNTVCGNQSVTFTATPTNGGTAPTFQWKKNGSNIATGATWNAGTSLATGDAITCVMTSNYPCPTGGISIVTSNTVNMTVIPVLTPSVSIGVSPGNSFCPGTNATFTATPTNGGTSPAYQWKKNGSNVGTNSTVYSDNTLTTGDVITCVLTSNTPCPTGGVATATSNGITINTSFPASVSIVANTPTAVCPGTPVTFTATPVNGGTASYQWKKNGGNVGTNFNVFTDIPGNGDVYSVQMTSNIACASPKPATSNTITITHTATITPSVSIAASPSNTVCANVPVTFTATPTDGGPSPTYQWKKNGNNIATGVSWNAGTSLASGDIVTVEMTSNAACASPATVTSGQVTMTIIPTVTPSVTVSSSIGINICPGATAVFTATPTNGGSTPAYQWRKNTVNVATGPSYTVAPASGDIIDVILTPSITCPAPATATSTPLTITYMTPAVPSVTITKTPNTAICPGTAVTFLATPTNGGPVPSYQWKLNGSNVGTNSAGFGSSSLNNNDIVSVTMTSTACASPLTASANTTITVNANTAASVSIAANPGNNICSGTGVVFTATPTGGGPSPTYQWKKNNVNVGTNSITYNAGTTLSQGDQVVCVMTSNATCATPNPSTSNAISMNVTGTVTPGVTITTVPTGTLCVGAVVQFIANPANSGNTPTYVWKLDNVVVPGATGPSFTDNGTLSVGNHTINVVMTSSVTQCITTPTASTTITKAVNPLVTPTITIASTQAPGGDACVGASVTFTSATTNAGTTPTYNWKKNGVSVSTASTYPAGTTLATGDVIICEMASAAACASPVNVTSTPINITVWPNITATATITANPGASVACTGLPVTFTASTTNMGSNPLYQWKKNGVNVGTNSPNYTDGGLVTGNTISCQVTTSIPCATPKPLTSNTLTITMNPIVTGTINLTVTPDSVGCEKTPFTFHTFHTNGGNNPAFQWYKNGVIIPGAAQAAYSSNNLADGDAIACELISNAVCVFPVMSTPMTVGITPSPVPTLKIAGVPDDQGIHFVAYLSDAGNNPTFQWRKNNHDIQGATGVTYKGVGLQPNDKINVMVHADVECANPEFLLSNTLEVGKVTSISTVTSSFDELTLFPNPNEGKFTVKGTAKASPNSKASIEVLNAIGQLVFKDEAELKGNELEVEVNLGGHNAAGMYLLRVTADGHTDNLRFIMKD